MRKIALLAIPLATSVFLAACGNITNIQNQEEVKSSVQNEQVASSSFYFTANEGGISKIDALTNKFIESIEVDGTVHNVQISPDDKIIGATIVPSGAHEEQTEEKEPHSNHSVTGEEGHGTNVETNNGKVAFYNSDTNELIKEVEVGAHPAHIVFTENNQYALVTNNGDNNVSVIDMKIYEVVHTIPTGNGPHGFRISLDSKFAYIANMNENTVSVIDLEKMEETKKIIVGNAPVTTGVIADGKILIATLNGENSLAIVEIATEKLEKVAVGEGPAQVYVQSDDKYAFVANQGTPENPSNSVTKVDLETKEVVATIEVGKGAHGIVTDEDNKFVYVTNMYDNTVSVIDNKQNEVIATLNVGEMPNGITIQ